MNRLLFIGAVVVATVWVLSCAAMVLIGVRAVIVASSVPDPESDTTPLTEGLTVRTGVLLILCGTLLGVPLFAFAFWAMSMLALGWP